MKKYSNTPIRDIIDTHPKVLEVLKDFDLPCQTCTDQNCLLKDIAENENLPMEKEMKFLSEISEAISGKTEKES